MPRKGPAPRRELVADPIYRSVVVTQLAELVAEVATARTSLRNRVMLTGPLPAITCPTQVIEMLHREVDRAEHDVVVVTAFFVPDEIDVDWYRTLVDRGVRIEHSVQGLSVPGRQRLEQHRYGPGMARCLAELREGRWPK